MEISEFKENIFKAGRVAVMELIKIAEEPIIEGQKTDADGNIIVDSKDLSADRLKNAAATKKLAIFDALEILARISAEENAMKEAEEVSSGKKRKDDPLETKVPFAERFASKSKSSR